MYPIGFAGLWRHDGDDVDSHDDDDFVESNNNEKIWGIVLSRRL